MAHDDSKNAVARCSFCGKPETLVHKLIEGPGVFICDECINLCYDLIDQTSSLNNPNPVSQPESKLLPKPEEIKAKLAEQYQMEADQIKKAIPTDQLASDVKTKKAIDLIVDSAVKE